jgi:hypothetical protein
MPANEYQFLTEWCVVAPRTLLYDILREAEEYPRWWPDVYLKAELQPAGRSDHIGDRVALHTKGWLPYTLHWTAISEYFEAPSRIEIRAEGDFVGRGVWQLTETGTETLITFDWRLRADKPLLRWLSPLLKPLFKWNHYWAMATGLKRLQQEAQRRRAAHER